MLILRQKMVAKPDKRDELGAALAEIMGPGRAVEGVISLDIANVLHERDAFIATGVYEHAAAIERQDYRPELRHGVRPLSTTLAARPGRTAFDASVDEALA